MLPYLSIQKKHKYLEIISTGKGIIPYELIINMESFFIIPDQDLWEKTEFFSELKQSVVNDEDYEHSKYLYQTLKMRHLGDLNDLYIAQDVILLTEVIRIVNPLKRVVWIGFSTSRKICVRISNQILVRNLSHFFHNFIIG